MVPISAVWYTENSKIFNELPSCKIVRLLTSTQKQLKHRYSYIELLNFKISWGRVGKRYFSCTYDQFYFNMQSFAQIQIVKAESSF